jgi:hypothetical protein
MLDSHRDARGISAFRQGKKTVCALLEGTKRIGDLGWARWILAEMVRGGKEGGDPNKVDAEIDGEVIMHIFNTYVAYTLPHLRTPTLVVADQSKTTDTGDTSKVTTEITAALTVEGSQTDSSSCPPRVILFNSALRDRSDLEPSDTASLPVADKNFRAVELNPKLLGAYLSVFYRYATLDAARTLFWKI